MANYQAEVVRRTLKTANKQLCVQYFSADSDYCNEVYNMKPEQMIALVSPVKKIRASTKKNQDSGDPYQNVQLRKCLDIARAKDRIGSSVILYDCKRGNKSSRKNQIFGYQNENLITWNGLCVQKDKKAIRLAKCGRGIPQQHWVYTTGHQLRQGGFCLSSQLQLEACATSNKFSWIRRSN